MNKYNLEYIEKLRIHELRVFARKLGVSSPTTMKKDELIAKITQIVKDKDAIVDGTREKEIDFFSLLTSDNSNILANLLSQNKLDKKNNQTEKIIVSEPINTMVMRREVYDDNIGYNFSDNIPFSISLKQDVSSYTDDEIYDVCGYLDIHPSGYGILRYNGFVPSESDSYLTSALVKKHKLKKGQYVYGKAKYVMCGKPKIVFEITKIDEGNISKNFDDLDYNGIGEEYYLDKFDFVMKKGERHYIENMSIKDAVNFGYDLVDENATSVKLINIKARPEDNYKSHQKMQIIHIPFNKTEVEVVNTVELVAERIKRDFEQGKQNVLIIYNFSELVRVCNIACEGCVDYSKINSKAINKIYNMLYLSKYVSEDVCCSVVCIDKNGVPRDLTSLMELDVTPLFNIYHQNINRKK